MAISRWASLIRLMAAILAGSAAPLLWISLTGEIAALTGYGLGFGVMYSGITAYAFSLLASSDRTPLLVFSIVCAGLALAHFGVMIWGGRHPPGIPQVAPRLVRLAFAVETLVLAGVGGALLLKIPNVLPWPLSAELSVMYGWVFLGLSLYYLYAVVKREWGHSIGQLLGFLVYDLVLIAPLMGHYANLRPEQRLGQITATAIILFSGALGIYFLILNKETRPRVTGGQARA